MLNRLRNWQVAVIIAATGFAVFWPGFAGPFMGDDQMQIQLNPAIRSVSNIPHFFIDNTGPSSQPEAWVGTYFRPMMMSVFTIVHALFGDRAAAFHVVQLLLYSICAFLVYLIFKQVFARPVALVLALLFLVHPMNSQVVYSIAAMQEPLFMLFGLLAILLLMRGTSTRMLILASISLLLSLLSKESGVLFVVVALLYVFLRYRRRFLPFVGILLLPVALFVAFKLHATGFGVHPHNGPINDLGIGGRLLTTPSILLFYLTKFIFPYQLATFYHWTHPQFSFGTFVLPLVIVLLVAVGFVYLGWRAKSQLSHVEFNMYVLFAAWLIVGLALHIQVIPLDLTACENWFVFPMVGLLGVLGISLMLFQGRIRPQVFFAVMLGIVVALGVRSAARGFDYRSEYVLAQRNIAVSKEDWYSHTVIARTLIDQGKFGEAKPYAERSIAIHPTNQTYNDLGLIRTALGDFVGARTAYIDALGYDNPTKGAYTYDRLNGLMLVYPDAEVAKQYYAEALQRNPNDCALLQNIGLFARRQGDAKTAKAVFTDTAQRCEVNQTIYQNIMNDRPFSLALGQSGVVVNF